MGSLVAGGLQSVFAAISFSAAGLLFKHLDKNGYAEEMSRHNRAVENLARSKELFCEREVLKHDEIQRLRQRLADANDDIKTTNEMLDQLRQIRTIQYQGVSYDREPQLSDFNKPSDEMREYQYIVGGALGLGFGYTMYKLI